MFRSFKDKMEHGTPAEALLKMHEGGHVQDPY